MLNQVLSLSYSVVSSHNLSAGYLHILQRGILFGSFVGVKRSTLFLIDYIGSKQASNVQNVS